MDDSQQMAHVHRYEIKGGPTCWAECACGKKFSRGNGVVAGSRQKLERALAAL
jgi:hypothetical protein